MKRYLLRAVLLAGAACVPGPAAWAHAAPNVTPGSTGPAARVDLQALVRSVHAGIAEWRDDLVRELVASQLTLIGGHPMPPFSPPVPPPSNPPPPLPTTSGTPPPSTPPPPPLPPPGQNPPPPPPPPGPPSPPPTPPPPPPPVPGGGPPPVNPPPPPPPPVTGTPEPASMVTALIGAGMASLVAWRNRRRKRAEA